MGVQGGPRRVFLQGSSKSAPQGVTAKGFPSRGVSQAGPRKRDPQREVPQVWSPKGGLPRAVAQGGSLWGEPKGVQQEGSSKDVSIGRSLKGLPTTGFHDGDPSGYTNVSQSGYRSGCPTRGVSKAGSPKRVPQGVPQGGSKRVSNRGGSQVCPRRVFTQCHQRGALWKTPFGGPTWGPHLRDPP
jgi:hypothetical protein